VTDVDETSYTGKVEVVVSTVDTGNKEVTAGETLTEGVDVVLAGSFLFFAVGSSLTIYTEGVLSLEDLPTLSMADFSDRNKAEFRLDVR
jgi:pentose-5-phosphate-3-epimerase